MDPAFWLARWERGETGFHLDVPNPWLLRQQVALGAPAGRHVLVPLCGKSVDLRTLADAGFRVTGIELSPLAVEDFFAAQGLTPQRTPLADGLVEYRHDTLRILCGDFFHVTSAQLGPVDCVWDRAALIALPPTLRRRYAGHLLSLLGPGALVLLVALEYPQAEMDGPPFSVPQAEIRSLFGPSCDIAALGREDALAREPRFRGRGLSRLLETCWLLAKRN